MNSFVLRSRAKVRSGLATAVAVFSALTPHAYAAPPPPRPKLVVVVSIDQFRADYLNRFRDFYLPAKSGGKVGGFNFLMEQGADYVDAHIAHVPTGTGPGHASILSGSTPMLNGIVGNEWFDRESGKVVYCVDDPSVETVGGTTKPMSPKNLKVTTVGDELKMATGGKSKVVAVSFKDRAAILLAGHAADTVIWIDSGTGNWVTSSFYAPSMRLPEWVAALNGRNIPKGDLGKTWTPLLPDDAYAIQRPKPGATAGKPVFSHPLSSAGKTGYKAWTTSAQGQEYVFATVKEAVRAEKLGTDDYPDLLAVNLATNDYVGHVYGPNSPEVMDMSVRTDRLLSDLFNDLQQTVPGLASVVIVVTADHGVMPIVEEEASVYRLEAIRISDSAIQDAISKALTASHGDGKWVLALTDENLYLNRALVEEKGLSLDAVQREAARAAMTVKGIQSAFAACDVWEGRMPAWEWLKAVARSYYPRLSGDVLVFSAPNSMVDEGSEGTGHGAPWTYDSHVPMLLYGKGIRAGIFGRRVGTPDIAATLAHILRIEQPSGNMGELLREATDR
jgi:predicted AlkP superfamily pyrophosphatase or phosphodiesterase